MTKKDDTIQIVEGAWYVVNFGAPYQEQCCHCALVHDQEWKIENGRIFFRYRVNKKDTALARKQRGITKEVQAVIRKESGVGH